MVGHQQLLTTKRLVNATTLPVAGCLADPPSGCPSLSALVSPATVFDDFARASLGPVVVDGTLTTSGHQYSSADSAHWFANGRYVSNARPGADLVAIAYLDLAQKPTVISGEFVFTAGPLVIGCQSYAEQPRPNDPVGVFRPECDAPGQNAVIGTAVGGVTSSGLIKGFGGGSIQLAIWHDHWRLFAVESPLEDPYAVLAFGDFAEPLKTNHPYRMAVEHREADSSAIVYLPDGSTKYLSHPYLNEYWGVRFGIQMRRSSLQSGRVEFLESAAR